MGLSRRSFLTRVGQAGGYSAAFLAMQGLGLMESKAEAPTPIAAPSGSGKGVKVVVLGGGIAGLVPRMSCARWGMNVRYSRRGNGRVGATGRCGRAIR